MRFLCEWGRVMVASADAWREALDAWVSACGSSAYAVAFPMLRLLDAAAVEKEVQ